MTTSRLGKVEVSQNIPKANPRKMRGPVNTKDYNGSPREEAATRRCLLLPS